MSWIVTLLIFIGSIMVVLAICSFFELSYGDKGEGIFTLLISLISSVLLFIIADKISNTPEAIDVYRGNTTLEITSVNGVPTDTTVVWLK